MPDRFPHTLDMRDLKYGKRSAEEKDRVARELREAGRHAEAVLLFEGRGDHPFLREEASWDADNGVAYLLLQIRKIGGPVSDDLIRTAAANAERKGRYADARLCYQALADQDALVRISPNLPPSLRTVPPPPEAKTA
jgi:hypothetical protein